MRNTFLLISIAFISVMPLKAKFNTITRVSSIEAPSPWEAKRAMEELQRLRDEEPAIELDSIQDSPDSGKPEYSYDIPERDYWEYEFAKARKRRPRIRRNAEGFRTSRDMSLDYNNKSDLPKLTIPNLIAEIKKNGILYPDVVLAQAILETGWFKSPVCRDLNNLFGLTNPKTKTYYEFNHWTESVKAYYTKVQYRYKGGNYLLWLDKIGYAEAPDYIRAVIRVMKMLRGHKV